jgi:hypothetical protein
MKSRKRSQLKRDLYRLAVARSDIAAAYRFCELLRREVTHIGHELCLPLFHAIVVFYGRPFTTNKPHGALPDRWSKLGVSRLQRMHDTLVDARNTYVAHSDAGVRTVRITPPTWLIPGRGTPAGLSVQILFHLYSLEFFDVAHETCSYQTTRMTEEIDLLLDELFGSRELPSEPFELTVDEAL